MEEGEWYRSNIHDVSGGLLREALVGSSMFQALGPSPQLEAWATPT